jgi:hypothetical protein
VQGSAPRKRKTRAREEEREGHALAAPERDRLELAIRIVQLARGWSSVILFRPREVASVSRFE